MTTIALPVLCTGELKIEGGRGQGRVGVMGIRGWGGGGWVARSGVGG